MPTLDKISVKFRNRFNGAFIDKKVLIKNKIVINVEDFRVDKSKVHGCENLCRMKLTISGRPIVTWHASANLIDFLNQCQEDDIERKIKYEEDKAIAKEQGSQFKKKFTSNFPIEDAILFRGDDKAYYLIPAPEDAMRPTDDELHEYITTSKEMKDKREHQNEDW